MCYFKLMELCVRLLVFGVLFLALGTVSLGSETIGSTKIIWGTNSSMFRDGGASLTIPLDSNFEIECPTNTNPLEYYKIYWIPLSAFESCFIAESDRHEVRLLVNCNKPNRTKPLSFVVEVKHFSGVPGGTDFNVGQNHYIGTFSTGTEGGLGNEYLGACSNFNMKLNLSIVEPETATTLSTTSHTTPSQNGSTSTTSTQSSTTTITTPKTSQQSQSTTSTSSSTRLTTISTSTDIPDIIISVPDGGNTGVIEANSARTIDPSWILTVLSLSLSVLFFSNFQQISGIIQR